MAKSLKLNIKNTQLAEALSRKGIKDKLKKTAATAAEKATSKKPAAKKAPAKKPAAKATSAKKPATKAATTKKAAEAEAKVSAAAKDAPAKKPTAKRMSLKKASEPTKEEQAAPAVAEVQQPRVKARSKSAFDEPPEVAAEEVAPEEAPAEAPVLEETAEETVAEAPATEPEVEKAPAVEAEPVVEEKAPAAEVAAEPAPTPEPTPEPAPAPKPEKAATPVKPAPAPARPKPKLGPKLGPTGRHVRDLLPKDHGKPKPAATASKKPAETRTTHPAANTSAPAKPGRPGKGPVREFRDLKPRRNEPRSFDSRDKHGLRDSHDDQGWRRRRGSKKQKVICEELTDRPTELAVRVPISLKDLAAMMKLKAAQLIQKLFMQGAVVTLNDSLDDETTVQLLGDEFGIKITIDTSEEERIRITGKTIKEEIAESDEKSLQLRAPVVAFMGHVDHGKTSLIDAIRASNITSGEAGAITQHIGAFRCPTAVGDLAILDTPGHEAFSAMRARGAEATDIVVLVIAGDEGVKIQTQEAIQHAKAAGVTIVVACNKCDKPGFDTDNVYRQLADNELLPESWGGQTVCVNTSAVTREGIDTLLEMLALQAEVLELQADPEARARGSVLESEMHKGRGAVTTVLVQNGTLRHGDALVFGQHWGRVKTMTDEHDKHLQEAGPSTPVAITGLSGLPEAGDEFIVVADEREARSIAEARQQEIREKELTISRAVNLENLFQDAADTDKKVLNIVLRADVQGSLEALKVALHKIESDKVDVNIILSGVGEISESDVQLAAGSKAVILGFHTGIESHADKLIKQFGVTVRTHDIIYHAVDDITAMMTGLLDKLAEEQDRGQATIQAVFKSSALGKIAGCIVNDGSIVRSHQARLFRGGEEIWKGPISSLKREKDDVKEVKSGLECGIVLSTNDLEEGDVIKTYEIVYLDQEL